MDNDQEEYERKKQEEEFKNKENRILEEPIKKVTKRKSPKDTEPEKPMYVSTRRYDLSGSDEEEEQDDAKLVIGFFSFVISIYLYKLFKFDYK